MSYNIEYLYDTDAQYENIYEEIIQEIRLDRIKSIRAFQRFLELQEGMDDWYDVEDKGQVIALHIWDFDMPSLNCISIMLWNKKDLIDTDNGIQGNVWKEPISRCLVHFR